MSFVKHIEKETRNARFQEPAFTTYSRVIEGDEIRVQLQSYGSESRSVKGTASQTMQFDKDSAKELIQILDKEFGFHLTQD